MTAAELRAQLRAQPARNEGVEGRDPALEDGTRGATVAKSSNPIAERPAKDALGDPAAESRRQRVMAILAANATARVAVVCDGEGDPVPVAVAIRDKGTCEVLIPASRFDPFALLEIVGRHGGLAH